jgi:hypothetical protein
MVALAAQGELSEIQPEPTDAPPAETEAGGVVTLPRWTLRCWSVPMAKAPSVLGVPPAALALTGLISRLIGGSNAARPGPRTSGRART